MFFCRNPCHCAHLLCKHTQYHKGGGKSRESGKVSNAKIATVVDKYNAPVHGGFRYDRFYVIKPFFVNNKIYYEVAFIPANDNASKTDSIIAFTDMEITSYYAVKFAIADNSIEIFDQRMPIRVIVDWEVNIRPCELKNFSRIVDNSSRDYGSAEQRNISLFLTKTGLSLSEVIMFSDEAFAKLKNQIVPATKAIHFFDCLEKCRDIIKQNAPGSNILRYLLHHLTNRVLRRQYKDNWRFDRFENRSVHVGKNSNLSDLYLDDKCIPFDEMPLLRISPMENRQVDFQKCLGTTICSFQIAEFYLCLAVHRILLNLSSDQS